MTATAPAILPDHVLSAIFTLAKRKSGQQPFRFRGHDFQLQEIFSELSRSGDYPLLSKFVFSNTGPEPYSPALSESVSRLQLSGLIGRENPDYEIVFLRPAAEKFFDNTLKPTLSPKDLEQLEKIAEQFLARVPLDKPA